MSDTQVIDCPATVENLVLTVVVDNVPGREDLETAWGLAVLVQGADTTVLFDTGPDGPLLLGNLRSLGIDPSTVDAVFLSHDHRDHTGGMRTFLEANPDVTVYLLPSFSAEIKTAATSAGAEVVEVAGPLSLCPGLCTLGRLGVDIPEQSLGAHTPEGLVLLTGCAHPGVENIVANARRLTGGDVLLVAGGFHLRSASPTEIDAVVAALVNLGVRARGSQPLHRRRGPAGLCRHLRRPLPSIGRGLSFHPRGPDQMTVFKCQGRRFWRLRAWCGREGLGFIEAKRPSESSALAFLSRSASRGWRPGS